MKNIFLMLLIAPLFLQAEQMDEFTFLETKQNGNKLDLGEVIIGRDYIVKTELKSTYSGQLKSLLPSCDCIEILEKPKSVKAAKNFLLTFLMKTTRPRKFSISLELVLESGEKERFLLLGDSIVDRSKNYINPKLISKAKKSVNRSLYLDANRLISQPQEIVIIDLRKSIKFLKSRIPNSTNLSFLDLQTNDSLKSSTIVLVSSPAYTDFIERQCQKLRQRGFKNSYILQGGIIAWKENGGDLTGVDKPDINEKINSREAFLASAFKETWFVGTDPQQKSIFPNFTTLAKKALLPKDHFTSIICLDIKSLNHLKKQNYKNVLLLPSGYQGYKKYLIQYSSILSADAVLRRQKISNCQGCP